METKEQFIKNAYLKVMSQEAFNYHCEFINSEGKIFQYNVNRFLVPNFGGEEWNNNSGYYWPKTISENSLKYCN